MRILLFFFIFILYSNNAVSSDNSKFRIIYIKIDNQIQVWGEQKIINNLNYDSLNEDGTPENLKISKQFKLFTIKFGLNDGSNGTFRYKLIGHDSNWSKIDSKSEVSYFGLTPGHYTFIIQLYENGLQIEQKRLSFEILPPFDDSLFYYIISFLIYLILTIIILNIRTSGLRKNKKILEKTVEERTLEVVKQKDEITLQKSIVEEKHKEISDSINYAKRIQSALLTSQAHWDAISPENFVLWHPKDVVSGDFYWAYQLTVGNKHLMTTQEIAVWCAADCTGHGVPGAFMSMLGMSFLNEIVIENINLKPSDILNKLRKKIINALEHGGTGNIEQRDGMDMALCVWNKGTNLLEYAGANNPVWIIRAVKDTKAHEIIELKPNRMPVGRHYNAKDFTEQKFQLQKGDSIYVFTDGFVDQFGGPDGKKYKSKKFKEKLLSLQHLPMQDQALMINKEFNDWRGNTEQIDDLCLVGIKVTK